MLVSPSRLDVMEAPSATPTTFEDELGEIVKRSWLTNREPKGDAEGLTSGPVTPFTMRYTVLFMASCW